VEAARSANAEGWHAKLRHIAIAAEDPEKMANYKKAFDLRRSAANGVLADVCSSGRHLKCKS